MEASTEVYGGYCEGDDLFESLDALWAKAVLSADRSAAERNGKIYLDLADDEWRVVEVNTQGWHILSHSPVVFRRHKALAPLTEPQQGGSLDELATFTNLSNDDWVLLLAFLVSCLNPQGPFPLLVLTAEQGSGKSTQAKVIKSLVDPNTAPLRSEPHDTRDLMIAATHSWLLAFDKLSRISPNLSDALCRLSTGGGFATRTLYQNDEETIFNAMRPVILTGIEELTTRPDLLDRAIIINLPRITEERRMTEREFWAMFEEKQPFILGPLLDAVSSGLRKLPQVKLTETPRIADFATWATACEEGLGLESKFGIDLLETLLSERPERKGWFTLSREQVASATQRANNQAGAFRTRLKEHLDEHAGITALQRAKCSARRRESPPPPETTIGAGYDFTDFDGGCS